MSDRTCFPQAFFIDDTSHCVLRWGGGSQGKPTGAFFLRILLPLLWPPPSWLHTWKAWALRTVCHTEGEFRHMGVWGWKHGFTTWHLPIVVTQNMSKTLSDPTFSTSVSLDDQIYEAWRTQKCQTGASSSNSLSYVSLFACWDGIFDTWYKFIQFLFFLVIWLSWTKFMYIVYFKTRLLESLETRSCCPITVVL